MGGQTSGALVVQIAHAVAVTPNDSTDIAPTRGIYQESTGDVSVVFATGETEVTLPGLQGGVWHPMRVTRIRATGTTASTVYAGY